MPDSTSQERVRLDIEDGIATVTLDRPNKLNALYPEMILRLVDVIEQIRRDNAVRVMVLRGEGRSFCAGDDLSPEDRFKYGPPDLQTRMRTGFPRAVVDMLTLRKPVVGIVQGHAVGAGLDLALACDFRFCDPACRFGACCCWRTRRWGRHARLRSTAGSGASTSRRSRTWRPRSSARRKGGRC